MEKEKEFKTAIKYLVILSLILFGIQFAFWLILMGIGWGLSFARIDSTFLLSSPLSTGSYGLMTGIGIGFGFVIAKKFFE